MRCVKTGLTFQVPAFRDDTFHGDLFFNVELGIYLIRGIAYSTSDVMPQMILNPVHDAYAIAGVDAKFADKFKEMNDHDIRLDMEGPMVLIDDTRFFN